MTSPVLQHDELYNDLLAAGITLEAYATAIADEISCILPDTFSNGELGEFVRLMNTKDGGSLMALLLGVDDEDLVATLDAVKDSMTYDDEIGKLFCGETPRDINDISELEDNDNEDI